MRSHLRRNKPIAPCTRELDKQLGFVLVAIKSPYLRPDLSGEGAVQGLKGCVLDRTSLCLFGVQQKLLHTTSATREICGH